MRNPYRNLAQQIQSRSTVEGFYRLWSDLPGKTAHPDFNSYLRSVQQYKARQKEELSRIMSALEHGGADFVVVKFDSYSMGTGTVAPPRALRIVEEDDPDHVDYDGYGQVAIETDGLTCYHFTKQVPMPQIAAPIAQFDIPQEEFHGLDFQAGSGGLMSTTILRMALSILDNCLGREWWIGSYRIEGQLRFNVSARTVLVHHRTSYDDDTCNETLTPGQIFCFDSGSF